MKIGSPSTRFASLSRLLALLAAGRLALHAARRAASIAVCAMLATGMAMAPAQAALFHFRILFDEGPLAGSDYTGSFQTGSDAEPGWYYPDHVNPARRLLTFDITIAGASFDRFDDVLPGPNPVVGISSDLTQLMSQRIDFHTADDAAPYLFIWLYDGDVDFNVVTFQANPSDAPSRGSIVSITQGIDDLAIPPNTPEGERLIGLLGPDGLRARFPVPVEASAVPAPASLVLLGAGLWMFAAVRRGSMSRRRIEDRSLAQMADRAAFGLMHAIRARCRAARALAVVATCAGGATIAQAASVHLANIVPVATAVNDFELAPEHVVSTWSQNGVRATQLAGDNAIWLASGLGNGSRSWYPDAGDHGWTRIGLDGGHNFDAVSFFGGSGWSFLAQSLYFELADDGVVVLSGTLDASFNGSWFGFAGGDFDEVNIRASQGAVTGLLDCPSGGVISGECNFAWVDDIRVGAAVVALPSSATLAVLALGLLAGLHTAQRRKAGDGGSSAQNIFRYRAFSQSPTWVV